MPWWRFDPNASLHDRVRFHLWRALAFGAVVGLVFVSFAAGAVFALAYGSFTAALDELRRRGRRQRRR